MPKNPQTGSQKRRQALRLAPMLPKSAQIPPGRSDCAKWRISQASNTLHAHRHRSQQNEREDVPGSVSALAFLLPGSGCVIEIIAG
jgi:hypothetical protein